MRFLAKVWSIKIQHHKVPMFFCTFCKNSMFPKIWFLNYGPKTSKQIRMQDSLNHNISQKTWGMKLNFWIWLEVQESTKYWLVASRFGHFLTNRGAQTQPGCNEIPCGPKTFRANQIAGFFYTKFKHRDQHQNQHYDWNLLNKI